MNLSLSVRSEVIGFGGEGAMGALEKARDGVLKLEAKRGRLRVGVVVTESLIVADNIRGVRRNESEGSSQRDLPFRVRYSAQHKIRVRYLPISNEGNVVVNAERRR